MKKIISSILIVVLVISVMQMPFLSGSIFSIKAQAKDNSKSVTSIEVEQLPEKTDYYFEIDGYESYYEYYNQDDYSWYTLFYFEYPIEREGLIIKVNYSDGSFEFSEEYNPYYFNGNEITIESQTNGEVWNIGEHDVTVTYMDKVTSFSVNILENPLESIELVSGPQYSALFENVDGFYRNYYYLINEWNYEEGEYFVYNLDFYDFELRYNFKDGSSVIGDENYFTSSHEITGQEYGETWDIGEHVATLNIMNCAVDFNVTVIESPIKSIKIVSLPKKTEYFEGFDGRKNTYIEYEYDEYHDSWVDVEHEYFELQREIDVDGLLFEIEYADGNKQTVDADYQYKANGNYYHILICHYNYFNSDDRLYLGENTIEVSFMGKTTSFNIKASENPFSGIEFTKLNIKDSYMQNEYVDIYGSEIKVNYKNGNSETFVIDESEIIPGIWSISGGAINNYSWHLNSNFNGDEEKVVFKYLGFSIDIPITRNDKYISNFRFITEPSSYTAAGSEIELTYSDNTTENAIIKHFEVRYGDDDEDDIYVGGIVYTTKGVFNGWYALENYKDIDNSVYKFSIGNYKPNVYITTTNKKPILCYYSWLLNFNLCYWELNDLLEGNVYYDGEINKDNIDSLLLVSNSIMGDHWNNTLDATTANQFISSIFNVENVDLTMSENFDQRTGLYTLPDWGGYGGKERFEEYIVKSVNDGISIEFRFGTKEDLESNYFIFDKNNRCSYFGKEEKDYSNIEIISNPFKLSYFEGDEVSTDGLVLKYTDKFGDSENITEGFEVSPSKISVDTKEITVSYDGKTVLIPIDVTPLKETGIELLTPPTKLNYICGEKLNSEGLTVTLRYNNGKETIVDSGFMCTPENLTVPGNQIITVYYHGFTTTFSVKVNESEVEEPAVHSVDVSDVTLGYKKSASITTSISANNGAKYTVSYSSSNPGIASVDDNGNVYGAKRGSATITCTVTDEYGNSVTDTCTVKVSYTWWQWILKIILFGWIWY